MVDVDAPGDGVVQPRVGRQAGGHRGGPRFDTRRAPLGGTPLRALPAVCPGVDGDATEDRGRNARSSCSDVRARRDDERQQRSEGGCALGLGAKVHRER